MNAILSTVAIIIAIATIIIATIIIATIIIAIAIASSYYSPFVLVSQFGLFKLNE